MNFKYFTLAALFICTFLNSSDSIKSAIISLPTSQQPAVTRAFEIINLINSHNQQQVESYFTKNCSDEFATIPMKHHLHFILDTYDTTQGLTFKAIKKSTPTFAALVVTQRITGTDAILTVTIIQKNSLISNIGFRGDESNVCTKKLTKKQVAKELDAYVKKLVKKDLFSGCILLADHGRPFYIHAFGQANKDFQVANTVDTKFNLGSMNKMFTAVAIAQLVEQGKLSFEDTLDKFLPSFPNAQDAKKIKIKHLLSHTSGLGNYFNDKFEKSSRALYRTVDDMLAYKNSI